MSDNRLPDQSDDYSLLQEELEEQRARADQAEFNLGLTTNLLKRVRGGAVEVERRLATLEKKVKDTARRLRRVIKGTADGSRVRVLLLALLRDLEGPL